MPYEAKSDVALREFAVRKAVEDLSETMETFNYGDIATHIGCSESTVSRAMEHLKKTKQVVAFGNKRNGYRYEVALPAYA